MKIVKISSFLVGILCFFNLEAQNVDLTKKQMHADFSKLISIFENCNAQLPIRKAVTGIDQLQIVKNIQPKIDTISSLNGFYSLLKTALGCMYDIHARQVFNYYTEYDNLKGIDTLAIAKWKHYSDSIAKLNLISIFPVNPIYINGEYFLHGTYECINIETKDTIRLKNAKILYYNKIPYNQYVKENLCKFAQIGTRWNYNRNEYYSTTSNIPFSGVLTVENENKIIEFDLNAKYGININGAGTLPTKEDLLSNSNTEKVQYFEKDEILYIYLKNMNSSLQSDVPRLIKEIGRNKNIKKVIIDVRENTGGSDDTWHNVLKAIIADSLPCNPQLAFKNTKELKKVYSFKNAFTNIKKLIPTKYKWLPNEKFLVTNIRKMYFTPDSNSLKYSGKIYLLQNENVYSAGHSLTTYAWHTKQLVSVETPTGLLAGFGLLPALFQLPNSKFTFRLETAIDVTNAQKPLDVYQDFPEITIETPAEKQFEYIDDKVYNQQSEEYLYKYDYLFQKVLQLE